MDAVRVLIVGMGGMGQEHARRLLDVPDARIVGMVDPSSAAIAAARAEVPALEEVPAFGDLYEALHGVPADMAVIVSLHSQHLTHGLACLEAGLHVLMEKPFVAGSVNAERLIAYAQEQGKLLAVSYQRHLEGPYVYLRELVASGGLGRILAFSAYQSQQWLAGTTGTWRQDPEKARGGQLNDSGSHLLDVILWVTGLSPIEVSAVIDNRGTRVDIDSALAVRCEGGAIGTFTVVGSAVGIDDVWEDIVIHGDRGTAFYRRGTLLVARDGAAAPVAVPPDDIVPDGDPDRDFVEVILGRKAEPAAPAWCGLAVARLTEAAWESARRGCAVSLMA